MVEAGGVEQVPHAPLDQACRCLAVGVANDVVLRVVLVDQVLAERGGPAWPTEVVAPTLKRWNTVLLDVLAAVAGNGELSETLVEENLYHVGLLLFGLVTL